MIGAGHHLDQSLDRRLLGGEGLRDFPGPAAHRGETGCRFGEFGAGEVAWQCLEGLRQPVQKLRRLRQPVADRDERRFDPGARRAQIVRDLPQLTGVRCYGDGRDRGQLATARCSPLERE
jgi:hypothetical protein